MFDVVVGHSDDPDSMFAIEEVLEQCKASLQTIPKAGILLAAIDYDHGMILQHIHQTFPGIQLIGGTTDGELSSKLEFQQDSLVLMLFCADEVEFVAGVGRNVSSDPVAIAHQAAEHASAKLSSPPKLCITIPESLTTSGVLILDGLSQSLGHTPIVGGTTGDQRQLNCTTQFFQTDVLHDAVPILLASGNLLVGHSVSNGWIPMGEKGTVTSVDGNTIYEINGAPAIEFCQDVGMERLTLEYRIAVFEPGQSNWYLRTSNGHIDQDAGSITFFADIPLHAEVQLVRATRDDILQAVQTSTQQALSNYPGHQPSAALFFSCSNRRHVLGTRTKEEYQSATRLFQSDLPICGFYCYGEIGPMSHDSPSRFHNESFVSVVLGAQ